MTAVGGDGWLLVIGLGMGLTAYNVVLNIRTPRAGIYVAMNAAATVGLLVVARGAGVSWAALGLTPDDPALGARAGMAIGTAIAVGFAAALANPRLRRRLADERAANLDAPALAFDLFVRIPIGTAALEEVAFRGVAFAAFAAVGGTGWAIAGSSVLFGLWHIMPTRNLVLANAPHAAARTVWMGVILGVVATAVAGIAFSALRLATGGIRAPFIVHTAANTIGQASAYAAHHVQE